MNRGTWVRLQSIGCKKSDTTEVTEHAHMHKTLSLILNSIISQAFSHLYALCSSECNLWLKKKKKLRLSN